MNAAKHRGNPLPELFTARAGCKVNLSLDITGVRDDGYHELVSLFYPLPEPADEITVTPALSGAGCSITGNVPGLNNDANTMAKAWRLFSGATGFAPDIHVHLTKNIPMGAGLGGGSSDAAVLLGYLNGNADESALPTQELNALAARVGADVPFFLQPNPSWATGIGEELSSAKVDLSGFLGLLACPRIAVSTAWAYAAWDEAFVRKSHDSLTWRRSDIKKVNFSGAWLRNDFETVVFHKYPEVREIKEILLAHKASGSVMSGSGSSVFALFRERAEAEKAEMALVERDTAVYMQEFQVGV